MMSFRFKQIALALCLVASLLVGSASACVCSHHHEKAKSEETSCHGSHEVPVPAETTESAVTENAFDVDCICFVNQPSPVVVSKSEKSKAGKTVSNSDRLVHVPVFVAVKTVQLPSPEFERDLSYSKFLKSLLPARAPPRL